MAAALSLEDYADKHVPTHEGGAMDAVCKYCSSYNFDEERVGHDRHFTLCCQNHKISREQIGTVAPPPPELLNILSGRTAQARRAREALKQYNNAFAFLSYGADCFQELPSRKGPPVMICHGAVYHSSGFLFPEDAALAKYA